MKRNLSSENQHIEWKVSWRDEYIKWICGFANAQGGTLVIGKMTKGILLESGPSARRAYLGYVAAEASIYPL